MREPTQQEIAKFKRACKALDELGRAGFRLYLGDDTMYLMTDSSHNENGVANFHAIQEQHLIQGAGGGGW